MAPPKDYGIREATAADIVAVASNCRPEDERECVSAYGMGTEAAYLVSFYTSAAASFYTLYDAEGPVVIFGAAPHPHMNEGVGPAFMMSTPRIRKHLRAVLLDTSEWFALLHRRFPVLTNYVDARNTTHVAWLRRAGASLSPPTTEFAVDGSPFHSFVRYKEDG